MLKLKFLKNKANLVTADVAMPLEICDIGGLDKLDVVRALWKSSMTSSAAKMVTPEFAAETDLPDEEILKALDAGYIDYLNLPILILKAMKYGI